MNQEIIVHLIVQDMKHQTLLTGLERLGLTGCEKHDLDIISVVANLMGIQKGKRTDRWSEIYYRHIHESTNTLTYKSELDFVVIAKRCLVILRKEQNK